MKIKHTQLNTIESTNLHEMPYGEWHKMLGGEAGDTYFVMKKDGYLMVTWKGTSTNKEGWCVRTIESWAKLNRVWMPLTAGETFEMSI